MPRTQIPLAGGNRKVPEHNLYDFRSLARNSGNIFFVDSGASASGSGLSPEDPVTTWDAAIGLCTANNGDVIVILEGHAESTAVDVDMDVAGVTVIGLGSGENRPVITFTGAGAKVDVDAANCRIANLVLKNDVASQTAVIDVDGAGTVLEDLELLEGTAKQFLVGIDLAEDRCTVRRCYVKSVGTDQGCNSGIKISAAKDRITIEDCEIFGDFADAAVHNPTGTVATRLSIRRNQLTNLQSGDHAIELVSACTGVIAFNVVNSTLAAAATRTAIDPGSCYCVENYGSDGVGDVSGVLNPAADT